MPAYHYRAVHAEGMIVRGARQAANESDLAQHLTFSGLELIEARVRKEHTFFRSSRQLKPRELAIFSAQMQDMLQAGVSFTDSLREIIHGEDKGFFRDSLSDILQNIHNGSRIAVAFAAYARLFPPVYISILQAGEISGNLVQTFSSLTRYAESRATTTEQLRRALRYPLFLVLVAFGVVTFMMTMVVPKVTDFLNTIDSNLPLMTKMLIGASTLFSSLWWPIVFGTLCCVAVLRFLHRHSEYAAFTIDAFFLRLPVLGNTLRKLAFARFAHSFAILFQSGIGVVASLRSAKATLGNRALEMSVDGVMQQVQSGLSLSQAFNGLMPSLALRMLRTGEQSGHMAKSLNDIAAAYDREVDDVTTRLIGMLEPTLTLLIGGVLAWVVLAVLGPIYASLGHITGGN